MNLLTLLADPATDHKLKWDMFKLSELECFDSMMFRMFKQEMETLISRHEAYRYDEITFNIAFGSLKKLPIFISSQLLNNEIRRRLQEDKSTNIYVTIFSHFPR